MSSHREAPEISKDPVADNTDVYAFVSPDQPDTVTLIIGHESRLVVMMADQPRRQHGSHS